MSSIEFHNNGVIDSLTHAPAPAVFLEILKREHARYSRSAQPISVISLSIQLGTPPKNDYSLEQRLIDMTRRIRREMRSDETFCRISECGFWVVINGNFDDAEAVAQRIVKYVGSENAQTWRIIVSECVPGLSCDDWIRELDRVHFC
jgi:hypothetical protein